jgi:ribosomal protein L17
MMIDRLKHFAYDTLMTIYSLNPVIFKELASYLSRGDITGTFKRSYAATCSIEKLLTLIKQGLSVNRLPVFWKLNEICAETTLFGSFAARVFHEIK